MLLHDAKQLASDVKYYESYSRFDDIKNRYETWDESVTRVMNMHKEKYKNRLTDELLELMEFVRNEYSNKLILGAQRALQFGGEQLLKHEFKMYNCTSGHLDRIEFFGECMYLLLCGSGVGFSVQKQHIEKLPKLVPRSEETVTYTIPDSIEGWAEAIDVLFSSFVTDGKFPNYSRKIPIFDYSNIRPKGSTISGGFKAPGPEPLKKCINKCEQMLNAISNGDGIITSINAYDLAMHIADAVISGGVRRAATIALFSPDDQEMLESKTGNWFIDNPQRARSNNSIVLKRDETSLDDLKNIIQYVKQFGEPGFILTDDKEFTYNPCVEIGMLPKTEDGRSGFQACNLCEINGSMCDSEEVFYRACKAASIMGTLQAGYTNFKYVSDATREIVEREALLGVSITGWMNNPHILFDESVMKKGAEIVNHWNKIVSNIIGINQAARTTCVKPSGNASVLLKTANGIHGEHSPIYFRHIQMNKESNIAKIIKQLVPEMVEDSVWSSLKTDYCVAFPFVATENSIFKQDLIGIGQLEYVKKAQQHWVEYGTNLELCRSDKLRHNVSNTVTVDNWEEVIDYVYDNMQWFAGISFIAVSGDKDYAQAPNASVLNNEQLLESYGEAIYHTDEIISKSLDLFDNNLWLALSTTKGMGMNISGNDTLNIARRRLIDDIVHFNSKWFNNIDKTINCIKDVYYHRKWNKIQEVLPNTNFDWEVLLNEKRAVDIDTMGAIACSGLVGCEI